MANDTTSIAAGTSIKGEILAKSGLHIDGTFEGRIFSDSTISVGQGGFVTGEIIALKLIVSGKFNGKADCQTIEIMPNGRIDGEVISNELVIEREGFFVGESKVRQNPPSLGDKLSPLLPPNDSKDSKDSK